MEKDRTRQNRVVAHIGTAHDDIEMRALLARAEEVVLDGQLAMDLGLEQDRELRGQTLRRAHWLLWRVLQEAYRVLGFDQATGDRVFEQLVLARIVEPASKVDTIRILKELGVDAPHENTRYNALSRCAGRDYRARIQIHCRLSPDQGASRFGVVFPLAW